MSGEITKLLRDFYPEFWVSTLEEENFLDVLHDIYSTWYASAYAKTVQIQNSLSIKKIDSFVYDYYSTIDCSLSNQFIPTDRIPYYEYCFKVPHGHFYLELLSYDSHFTDPIVDSQLCFDKVQNQFFLAIGNTEYTTRLPKTLFIQAFHNMNKVYPFQHFFTFRPLIYNAPQWAKIPGTESIYTVPLMYDELEYVKAQYTNMMYTLSNGPTYDALDSLFAVVFRKVFSRRDGVVVDYTDNEIWINHGSMVVHYTATIKNKFKERGFFVRQYEALEDSPVELLGWDTNPAKFAQLLIGDHAKVLEKLIGVHPGEKENSLVYNDLSIGWNQNSYDMGGHSSEIKLGYGAWNGRFFGGMPSLLEGDWRRRNERFYNHIDYSCAYQAPTSYFWAPLQTANEPTQVHWAEFFEPFRINYPETGDDMVLHRYDYWTDIRYGNKFIYEMMKNVVVWHTAIKSEYHKWIAQVLDFYRPLHLKYVPSPMNGVDKAYTHGSGRVRGRHYGGIRTIINYGYGNSRGRRLQNVVI